MVLQVLYENLKDKSKVLTSSRVSEIKLDDSGATAITINGESYKGDIIIGADGIHSKVRDEMWRLANKLQPGLMDPAEAEG